MIYRALKWLWMLAALIVLLVSLVTYNGESNSDADVLLAYGMLGLSFPIGLVVSIAAGFLGRIDYELTGHISAVSYSSIIMNWLVFFVVGYMQWFMLVPQLWRRWKAKRGRLGS